MVSAKPGHDTHEIWVAFSERLRGYIARRVENPADVDDILQEVFLRVHRHAADVERSDRLVAWLYQVTRNAIIDHYRARGRRERPAGATHDLELGGDVAGEEAEIVGLVSSEAGRELASCLGPMVDRLPPLYREAVRLVELEGLSHRDAAARVGITVSGMKSRVQRGRQALHNLLLACCAIERDAGGRITDYQPHEGGCGPCACGCGPELAIGSASSVLLADYPGSPRCEP